LKWKAIVRIAFGVKKYIDSSMYGNLDRNVRKTPKWHPQDLCRSGEHAAESYGPTPTVI
jgi:hypothetical protein